MGCIQAGAVNLQLRSLVFVQLLYLSTATGIAHSRPLWGLCDEMAVLNMKRVSALCDVRLQHYPPASAGDMRRGEQDSGVTMLTICRGGPTNRHEEVLGFARAARARLGNMHPIFKALCHCLSTVGAARGGSSHDFLTIKPL